jgi:hypothetical protein
MHPGQVLAGRGSVGPIELVVTISDVDGSGNPYGIQSDGLGAYINGVQEVQAVLDQYGTFAFNTAGKRTAPRLVKYNFNNPVDPSNTYRPTLGAVQNHHFSTGGSNYSPFIPIQNLGINGNPVSECAYMGNGIADGLSVNSPAWRVSFHKGLEDVSNGPTAFAVITRTSVSPAVWTITPSGACSPVSNVASLRSSDTSFLYGYYNLPFMFTLRAK